ncbi:hypothetical protein JD844_025933 [Phrynosoma platyrhinos]|uniref:protein-serine/threonine phosphatase n=1 Tax=Phrynosoma platyrhinos TaxID=52577 RepID=A0ABQ7SZS5_PHRPL|nr:hypothetical protein JD844_025933 [Phrynosoma platyrhinos]
MGEQPLLMMLKHQQVVQSERKRDSPTPYYEKGNLLVREAKTQPETLTTEEVIRELALMAKRSREDCDEKEEKVADEDDVDKEEAALLHEEATMTIEELLTRYGQNCIKGKLAPPGKEVTQEGSGRVPSLNGEAEVEEIVRHRGEQEEEEETNSGKRGPASTPGGIPPGPDAAGGGDAGAPAEKMATDGGSPARAEAEPSCSSASKVQRAAKSRFFEDSEDESEDAEEKEEEEEEEEEEEDDESEECSEDEDGYSSEEAENEEEEEDEEEDDTEEAEEDEEEDEDMMLPGMDGKEKPGSDSGTTAVVALIRGKQLIVANAGDSRCVVSEGGKAVDMSYDHKPEDEVELARIKNAGGKVTMDGRVNGGLNLSRAIGDHFYKRNKNLPPEEQMISALPDIKMLTINDDHDFMVIACDGIWNVMSSQEVVDFVQSKIDQKGEDGELRPLSSIVEELLDRCLAPDTSGDGTGCDNMTCILISFKPRPSLGPTGAEGGKRKLDEDKSNVEPATAPPAPSPTEESCSKKARQD